MTFGNAAENNMYDVITIGAAVRDVFLISDNFEKIKSPKSATGAFECVSLGSKIPVNDIILTSGGGATNAAATFASLGYQTATVARVGNDPIAEGLLKDLKKHRIKTELIKTVRGKTGYSTLMTMPTGERSILVYRGVSGNFHLSDISWPKMKTKWIYLTSLGGNLPLVKNIVSNAFERNIQVAYNPGMKELKKGWRAFSPLLSQLSILMMNTEEAAVLTGKKQTDVKGMLKMFKKHNLILILTDGANGSYAQLGDECWFAKPSKVKVVSRTGAGDAFGSGFLAAIMRDDDLAKALQVATLNSQSVIGSVGAKNGILSKFPTAKTRSKIKVSKK